MDQTPLLKLPYILAAQSQKHVSHNEALRALDAIVHLAVADKDLGVAPSTPSEGDRYIVGGSASGVWSGRTNHIAAWQDGAWAFYAPVAGWLAWVDDESMSYLFSGGGWIPAPGGGGASLVPKGAWSNAQTYATGDLVEHLGSAFLSNVDANLGNEPDGATPASTSEWTYFAVVTGGGEGGGGSETAINPALLVGVNATADVTNRLSVASPASLFNHEGAGHQLKINKAAAGETASVLFQTGFSGRAEFGLAGDDNFHVKVSPNGSDWHEALVIDRATGSVSLPNTAGGGGGGRELLSANRTYYVRADGSDANTGRTNTSGGAFATIQKAIDVVAMLDSGIYDVTIQVGAGTWTQGLTLKQPLGAGVCTLRGDPSTPSNVTLSVTGADCIRGDGQTIKWAINGFKLQTTTSGRCIHSRTGAFLVVMNVEFGASAAEHMFAVSGAISVTTNYAISGGASRHVNVLKGEVFVQNLTITLTGTPAFWGAYAVAMRTGVLHANGCTFSGAATGVRYDSAQNAVIFVNGAGATYFPGDSTGSSASGGVYV